MLNVPLYNALLKMFGDVDVVNEDEQGEYEVPELTMSFGEERKKVYPHVTHWGEVYRMKCPVCEDHKKRLYVCHMFGTAVRKGRPLRLIPFGRRLYDCKNEHCNLNKVFSHLEIDKKDKIPTGYASTYEAPKRKPGQSRKSVLIQEVPLPKGAISLIGDEVPDKAYSYLIGRGFVPGGDGGIGALYNLYFAPKGSTYMSNGEEREFFEDRLVIPIINRNRIVSWQARALNDKTKLKYINPTGISKNQFIYNMDAAWQYKDVVLVEGVTDVWRVGPNAICCFGKTLSPKQISIMSILWQHCGRVLIVLDKDARDTRDKRTGKKTRDYGLKAKKQLEESGAFPRGVYLYDLPDARDPAEYDTRDIRCILRNEFMKLDRKVAAKERHERCAAELKVKEQLPLFEKANAVEDFE